MKKALNLRSAAAVALAGALAVPAAAHVFPNQTIINQGTMWNDDTDQAHGWELRGGLLTQTVAWQAPAGDAPERLPWEETSARTGLPVGSWSERVAVVPSDALERIGARGAIISADVALDRTTTEGRPSQQGLVFFVEKEDPAPATGLSVLIEHSDEGRTMRVTWPGGETQAVPLDAATVRPTANTASTTHNEATWVRLSVRLVPTAEGSIRVSATALPLSFEQGLGALASAQAEVPAALFAGASWGLAAATQTAPEESASTFYFDHVTATRGAVLPDADDSQLRVVGLAPETTPAARSEEES